MDDKEYQSLLEKRAVHDLVLAMSTESFQAASTRDLWLRSIILILATFSVVGSGLAWRNLAKSSELQIRLVRASELNTHLKEMNLAAAGLAHETRNPLNIIRGLAQMISKQPDTAPAIQAKSREIIDEADKVAAQLNEFINYSRPREVHRSVLALGSVVSEVVRALNYDLEEKKTRLQIKGEQLSIEADEQLLRQALFNLLLNAIQAIDEGGEIQVVAEKRSPSEAVLELRDNGPGVPPERRTEIFKPYFTTQKNGTGLGLAVVQQIVLAHGWEIECFPNEPHGAIFRIAHLKLAP
jgi:signal transduction histidine kinase